MFEFYRGERNPKRAGELVARGWTDLKTLQMLSKWDSETWLFGVPRTNTEELEAQKTTPPPN